MRCSIYALILLGCSWTKLAPYKPMTVEQRQGVTDADLYKASVRVFSDDGLSFRIQDRESGVLATQWISVPYGVDGAHHSWRVTIIDGEERIGIDCETPTPSTPFKPSGWTDCGDTRNPDWVAKAPAYSAKISSEAKAIADKRSQNK